jgi:hypothetical protein
VILVDANLLLHAYNPRSVEHEPAKAWLESVLSEPELVRFGWLTLWAFLRISTNPRVFERPLDMAEARDIIQSWLELPNVDILAPAERHWQILGDLLMAGQVSGPLVMDAVIAAIAIEHGAALQTTDRDFTRFEGLKWANPLSA